MIAYSADNGWQGTVVAIIDKDDGKEYPGYCISRSLVVLKDAFFPKRNSTTKNGILVVRCWQRIHQLTHIKVGDRVVCTNLDIDGSDWQWNGDSAENGGTGTFTVMETNNE